MLIEVALDNLGREAHAVGNDLAREEVQPDVEMVREHEMDGADLDRRRVRATAGGVAGLTSCGWGRQKQHQQHGHSPLPARAEGKGHEAHETDTGYRVTTKKIQKNR